MLILLIFIFVGACAAQKEVLSVPTNIPTLPTEIPTPEVRLTSTPTPVVTAVPTPTATPVPMSDATRITAEIVRYRCEQYRGIVEQVAEMHPVDPSLVLAVMAQESGCVWNAISDDGYHTVGLMQVSSKAWTASEVELLNVRINIEWGMYILYSAINHIYQNPTGDVHRGLAAYNCGWTSLNEGKCLPFGGLVYADKVLNFWLPFFEEK